MSSNNGIEPSFIDDLLAFQTRERQESFLRDARLLNADGLRELLDAAEWLTREDPGKAHRLAEVCADVADNARAPAALPHAAYVRMRTHNDKGEFQTALDMVKIAHDGYAALGMNLEALLTNAGKMGALLELGRYEEAFEAGQVVLNALANPDTLGITPTPQEASLLAAPVYQNFGAYYELAGQYENALGAYASSEEHYRVLGRIERLGEISDNRGIILSYLGRGSEALAAHERAAAIFERGGLTLSLAKALINVGETHLQLANHTRSLDAFENARRLLRNLDALAEECALLHNTASAYLNLSLYSEALATFDEANKLLQRTGMVYDRARTLWGIGSVMIARSEFGRAEAALVEAAALFNEAANAPLLSSVMLEQASLQEAQGYGEKALATARQALELVSENDQPVQAVYAHLRLADLLLPRDAAGAEPHLLEARQLADPLDLPQLRFRLDERLGRLRLLQGRDEEAQALLEAAVDQIERLRSAVAQEVMRISFLQDKTAAYEDLLCLHLARNEGGVRQAFAVAERAKSRALVDLLIGVAGETVGADDPQLEGRVRTLQADLNAIYGELLSGASEDGESFMPLPNLHARAVDLEQKISRLRLQGAATSSPRNLFAASALPENVQDRIEDGTTLLAYHAVGDEILAFVSIEGRIRVVRGLGTVSGTNQLLHKLDIQLDRFRAGQAFAERHMARMERSTRQVLAALYDELVAPLEPLLKEAMSPTSDGSNSISQLAIVPHGPLHRIPFHALFDGERYLIERFEISSAPSATIYALCQERSSRDWDRAMVFGMEDPSIPLAATEARAVAGHLPGAEVRVGEDATIDALRDGASGSGALHLACHGLFRSDNPMFSALKLHDGWLMAADAMNLTLPDALVTLSACESGRGEVIGGDEVLGLTRAFLGAGASTLAVSLWLVKDETTAELMGKYYERLRNGARPAGALRDAQLELKERYAHPYYWAPFVLIGKR